MSQNDFLTNEHLLKRFDNQFTLVTYAIQIAERMIASGNEPISQYARFNLATKILSYIAQGKDKYQNVDSEEELIETLQQEIVAENEIAQ